MADSTVSFDNQKSKEFTSELRDRVDAYFEENDLSKDANARMVAKTVAMLAMVFIPYFLILFGGFGVWAMLGLAIVMGVGIAGCGFSISHDALHGAYSSNKTVNEWLGLTFDLLGASSYLWKITHNVIHHTYTNIQGIDEDLEVSPLLRLSPESEHYWFHRFQHVYGFAVYSFSTLFWVFVKDYKYLLQEDLGPYQDISHDTKDLVTLFGMKLLYYGYMIVVPLLVLNVAWWQFAIGFVAMHLTAGLILGVVFQLAHVVEGPDHHTSEGNDMMEDAWLVHEVKTTANFARSSALICWYVGGLNFQIEHHLFPRICSVHYPAISGIVEEVANKHGIPYHTHPTLFKSIRSHYRMLKKLGTQPAAAPALST
ncbi:MAG TPA: acyl-CoA desaturase [Salinibacter sp.]|nr:acyl-CoA desaturase [Salinibacter sp.]